MSFVCSCTFWDEFHVNNSILIKNASSLRTTLPFQSVLSRFFLTQCVLSVNLLSAAVLPNFCQNSMFARYSDCGISSSDVALKSPSQQRLYFCFQCMHLTVSCWDERRTDMVPRLHLCAIVHHSGILQCLRT